MKKIISSLIIVVAAHLGRLPEVVAEFRCEAQVSYSVESLPAEKASPSGGVEKAAEGVATAPAVPTTSVTIVSIAQVDAKGEDEAKAKAALQRVSSRLLEKARATCRDKHENVGGCISAKFEANATALRSLDFSVRKALEESLRSDCEIQRGRCTGAELKGLVCAEIIVAVPASASPEAEAGKDEKKKGKK